MVEIDDIVDRESFREWLEQEQLSHKAQIALAHRASMRVQPIWWRDLLEHGDVGRGKLFASHILRCCFATQSLLFFRDDLLRNAASQAQRDLNATPFTAANFASGRSSRIIKAVNSALLTANYKGWITVVKTFNDAIIGQGPSSSARAAAYKALRSDCSHIDDPIVLMRQPLWPEGDSPYSDEWSIQQYSFAESMDGPWSFWLDWYQRALDGTETRWPLLREIAVLDKDAEGRDIWDSPERVAAEIARLEAEYYASLNGKTELAKAYPVDFTFDAMARVMRMVGIDDDMAHLRDPAVVQAFLDDCEELRDTLQDFADFANAGSGGSNRSGMLHLAAQKVLAELTRTDEEQHLRARHIVRLAQRLESFAKEKGARDELGETLGGILDESIDLLRTVTRKHFGPSYTALAPLAQLSLEQIDRDAVLELFDQVIARMEALPSNELVALDEDGLSVFRDMVRELHDFRAAIAEASTDEFRAMMESRFAESIGGTGLAFGRFLETSANAAGHVGAGTDLAIENYNRVTSLNDIVAFIAEWFGRAP